MSAPVGRQQAAVNLPLLLTVQQISKLTDAASEVFSTLYALEKAHKRAVTARLVTLAAQLDLFGPSLHYGSYEDYQPGHAAYSEYPEY